MASVQLAFWAGLTAVILEVDSRGLGGRILGAAPFRSDCRETTTTSSKLAWILTVTAFFYSLVNWFLTYLAWSFGVQLQILTIILISTREVEKFSNTNITIQPGIDSGNKHDALDRVATNQILLPIASWHTPNRSDHDSSVPQPFSSLIQ